ncbi:acylphosphatase [Candidatus Microgenomates bacterium]|nr:acylphosphatase [Candidatus Microgenomates bacterium]
MDIRRLHVYISGRVQGVSFRGWIQHKAEGELLTGWVKNLADGRVEAIFEGPKDKLEEILKSCSKGPEGAVVNHVSIIWEEATGEFKTFEII